MRSRSLEHSYIPYTLKLPSIQGTFQTSFRNPGCKSHPDSSFKPLHETASSDRKSIRQPRFSGSEHTSWSLLVFYNTQLYFEAIELILFRRIILPLLHVPWRLAVLQECDTRGVTRAWIIPKPDDFNKKVVRQLLYTIYILRNHLLECRTFQIENMSCGTLLSNALQCS